MSSIDERIVKMTFDNQDFESRVSKTLDTLLRLNDTLKKTGSGDGVSQLNKSVSEIKKQISGLNFDDTGIENQESKWKKFGNAVMSVKQKFSQLSADKHVVQMDDQIDEATYSMADLKNGVEHISKSFSALGVISATVLANITNKAVNAATLITRALTIDPVTSGFSEYETKVNAVSTILANTADDGETLDTVTAALNELNKYADDTIYNFAQMTENIGRFTAAGVGLDDSVAAIKGMSNLAAFFGVDATKASGAMYQLSQALAAGKIQLMDWNSFQNAGMSGEAFQKSLIRTSEVMGTGAENAIKKFGSFRESLTEGQWLTSEVMVETLKQISGAYKESELRAKGYSATQAKEIMDMAKTANKAATEVRTVTGMIDAMKESVQSGWAISWEYIIGDKEQATELLTSVKDAFESVLAPSTELRNNMLKIWNEKGGRDSVIAGLANVGGDLLKVLNAISSAWKEVFPPMTGEQLVTLSKKFKDFTERIKMSDETVAKIKDTFKGFFSLIDTGKDAVLSLFNGFKPVGALFANMGELLLNAAHGVGQFALKLSETARKSGIFTTISEGLNNGFSAIGDFFNNIANGIKALFSYIYKLDFGGLFEYVGNGLEYAGKILGTVVDGIGKAIGTIDFGVIFTTIKGLMSVEVLKTLKGLFEEVGDIGESAKGVFKSFSGIGKNIKETLESVRESLEAYQKSIQAEVIMKIAGALAILAVALILLASIDMKNLIPALGTMAVMLALVTEAMLKLMKEEKKIISIGGAASKIRTLSIAMLILALALKTLSKLNVGEMMTGLVGLLGLLATIHLSMKIMNKASKDFGKASKALIVFGIALHVMASALKVLGSIDSETLGGGLFAMGMTLMELAAFLKIAKFGQMGIKDSVGILILAGALLVLSQAVKQFGDVEDETIIRGLMGVAGIMAEIAILSDLMDKSTNLTKLGVGFAAMAGGLLVMSFALKTMGEMDCEVIGIGLAAIAGSLLILGVAGKKMADIKLLTLAVGIATMSMSLLLLSEALKSMGGMSAEQLAISFLALAGSLAILALAMDLMVDGLPGAAAMLVMSAALAIFVPQLIALSAINQEGLAIGLLALVGAFTAIGLAGLLLGMIIPELLGVAAAIALLGVGCLAAGAGISLFGVGLGLVAAALSASGLVIIEFVRALINLLPLLGQKAAEAITNFMGAIAKGGPEIVKGMGTIITSMLTAIGNAIPQIVQTAVDIVVAFAEGLADGVPKLVTAGLELIVGLLEGIANNIDDVVTAGADVVINFMDGVAEKLPEIIDSGINLALSFIEGVADGLINNQSRLETAISKVIQAVLQTAGTVITGSITGFVTGGENLIKGLIKGFEKNFPNVSKAAKGAITWAKKGLSNVGTALTQAGRDLINGFKNGITEKASSIAEAAKNAAKSAVNKVENFLGINSPSRVFMEIGRFTCEGFAVGLDKYSKIVANAGEDLANTAVESVNNPLSKINGLIDGHINSNPVIAPVMDLSNIKAGSRTIDQLLNNGNMAISGYNGILNTMGSIQNENQNVDIISALKDLKDSLGGNTTNSYVINGITYDDGSNIVNAVESLVRAARIERRI